MPQILSFPHTLSIQGFFKRISKVKTFSNPCATNNSGKLTDKTGDDFKKNVEGRKNTQGHIGFLFAAAMYQS